MVLYVTVKDLHSVNILNNQSIVTVPDCTIGMTNLSRDFPSLALKAPYPGKAPRPEQIGHWNSHFLLQDPEKTELLYIGPHLPSSAPDFISSILFFRISVNLLSLGGPV